MFIVITGGSGSGKSAYAEKRIVQLHNEKRYYIATMMCFDEESKKRIARHRKMREGKGFVTVERYTDLAHVCLHEDAFHGISSEGTVSVLLECMSNLAANEMYAPEGAGKLAYEAICSGIDSLLKQCDNLVVVTNEIFSDGMQYDDSTMEYMKLLGDVNTYMASAADEVVEVVYGIPCIIKSRAGEKSK